MEDAAYCQSYIMKMPTDNYHHQRISLLLVNISVFILDAGHDDHSLCHSFGNLGHIPRVSTLWWGVHGSPHTWMMTWFQVFLEMSLEHQRRLILEQMAGSYPTGCTVFHLHLAQSPARIKKQNIFFSGLLHPIEPNSWTIYRV